MLIYIIYHTLQIYTSLYYTLFHGIVLSAFQLLFDSMKVLYLPPFKQHENDPSTNMCKNSSGKACGALRMLAAGAQVRLGLVPFGPQVEVLG